MAFLKRQGATRSKVSYFKAITRKLAVNAALTHQSFEPGLQLLIKKKKKTAVAFFLWHLLSSETSQPHSVSVTAESTLSRMS